MAPTNSPSTLLFFFVQNADHRISWSAQPKPVLLVAAVRVLLLFLLVLRLVVGVPRTSHAPAQPQDATPQPPFPIASAFCIKGTTQHTHLNLAHHRHQSIHGFAPPNTPVLPAPVADEYVGPTSDHP